MNEAEKKFSAENGMNVAEAWDFVLRWKQEGKIEEAKKGAEEVLRFFPENQEARVMLKKIEKEKEMNTFLQDDAVSDQAEKKIKGMKKFFQKLSTPQNPLPGMQMPSEQERIAAIFSYFYILVVIPLFLKKDSSFVQFHAWQGVVLTVGVWILHQLLFPFMRMLGMGTFGAILILCAFLLYLYSIYSAYKGVWLKIPIIYPFSEKLRKIFSA